MIQSFISLKFSEFIFQSSFARVESWGAATEFLWSVSKMLVFLLSTSNFINNVRKKAVPIERLSKCLVLVDMSRNIHHTSPSLSGKAFPAKSCEFREKKEREEIFNVYDFCTDYSLCVCLFSPWFDILVKSSFRSIPTSWISSNGSQFLIEKPMRNGELRDVWLIDQTKV